MIKLGGIRFAVFTTDRPGPFDLPLRKDEAQFGGIDYQHDHIIILSILEKQQQHLTLWHEIVHSITSYENVSEDQVSRIAENLFAVLTDNNLLAEGWWEKILDDEETVDANN